MNGDFFLNFWVIREVLICSLLLHPTLVARPFFLHHSFASINVYSTDPPIYLVFDVRAFDSCWKCVHIPDIIDQFIIFKGMGVEFERAELSKKKKKEKTVPRNALPNTEADRCN